MVGVVFATKKSSEGDSVLLDEMPYQSPAPTPDGGPSPTSMPAAPPNTAISVSRSMGEELYPTVMPLTDLKPTTNPSMAVPSHNPMEETHFGEISEDTSFDDGPVI